MSLTETQKTLLQNIQDKLVYGDIGEIAKNINMTREYVSRVLSPFSDTYNFEIVKEATRIIGEREQDTKNLLKKISA